MNIVSLGLHWLPVSLSDIDFIAQQKKMTVYLTCLPVKTHAIERKMMKSHYLINSLFQRNIILYK